MELSYKVMTMDAKDIDILNEINEEAFPDDERVELPEMFRVCDLTNGEVLGWYAAEELIGYAMMNLNEKCAYLNYFAIKQSERSKGYGQKILQMLQEKYAGLQLIIDFEVMDEKAENYEIRKRRKAFYLRGGMQETGYYTKLSDNYFELVSNHGALEVEAAENLMKQVHAVMPSLSGKLYKSDEVRFA